MTQCASADDANRDGAAFSLTLRLKFLTEMTGLPEYDFTTHAISGF